MSPVGEVTSHRVRSTLVGNPIQNLGDVRSEARLRIEADSGAEFRTYVEQFDRSKFAGEAEKKAASKFGVPVDAIRAAAHVLWKRSLTEERDSRLSIEELGPSTELAIQKGHVTRELLDKIEKILTEQGMIE